MVADRLIADVKSLLTSKLKLIMFTDDFYYTILSRMEKADTVSLIRLPLDELHIYNMIMGNRGSLSLPAQRSDEKDTHEYLALMNTKIEFLYRVKDLVKTEYIAWIDAGASKMFSNKEECFLRLSDAKLSGMDKVLIPGCYIRGIPISDLCRSVWWIFLGTFFICNRNFVSRFYGLSLKSLTKFFIRGYVIWEVNIWADIMYDHPDTFEWYYSLHDDGLSKIPEKFLIS
jgi:hypothetical protein